MIFNLNKLNQVALVVKDLKKSLQIYWDELGIGPWKIWKWIPDNTRSTTYHDAPVKHRFRTAETMVGNVCLELAMHIEGTTIYRDFLEKKGEELHHIEYISNDIERIFQEFQKRGIDVIQRGKVKDDSYYYFDTESIFGVIIEVSTDYGWRPPDEIYPHNK